MSGHSKWATIKRAKGAADIQRGLTFTKIANAITIAVREGGGITDPENNFKLRLAVEAAKAANMPKENIERAIKRAVGKEAGAVEEVVYEGFAPNGVSVIIEAVTDNSQRTTAEIKSVFTKEGGNFGQPGSVAYQFKSLGRITIQKAGKTSDALFEMAVSIGAEDIEEADDSVFLYTKPEELNSVKDSLIGKGAQIQRLELIRRPTTTVSIMDPSQRQRVLGFLQRIEGLDDVQKVYSNLA